MNYPHYEIWGGWNDVYGYGAEPEHLEDCFTLSEAIETVREYRQHSYQYAFIKNKDTGEILKEY
jgi:hypothetical protein